ncbi:MAG: hypothetical protein JOZ69_12430 [Myxococcales bacterium]|nr:hypothetical protein [Myxococcales bacterium]
MTNARPSRSVRWIHQNAVDGVILFRRGKCGDRMVADWPGLARLTCAHDGSAARLVPATGASRRTVDGLRGPPVNALLRDLAGHLGFHASAVAVDGKAVMFLGESGAGKSTAAAEMCLRHGAQVLADDATLLEVGTDVEVLPGDRGHWLTRESCLALGVPGPKSSEACAKRVLRTRRVDAAPCPLRLVVALSMSRDLTSTVARLIGGAAVARTLLESVIRFDVEDPVARRREFEQLSTVHARTPFLELRRPEGAPGFVAPFVLEAMERGR